SPHRPINYAYRLKNWDSDWISSGQFRQAIYTNLPSGDYVFEVRAANTDGSWSKQTTRLKIELKPEFWQTWWFYLLIVLALLPFAIMLARQRKRFKLQDQVNWQDQVIDGELKSLSRLKAEFLAITAYELRTPIHGIIGLAESLIDGNAGELPHEAQRELAMMVSSGRRLTNQINDIVDFSQLTNRTIELKTQPVDIHALCDVVLMLSRPLLGDKDLKLLNEVASDLPAALADEDRLQQIIYNLIDNAIKFTDIGQVVISANAQNDFLKISIADTGVGIASNKLDNIFTVFENPQDRSVESFGGTGLGLCVSKQLVSLHGGTIEVESSVGWGTTFSFTLPISE
ncbi:MAG: ATP-binding protein, partial [Psychrosphaera sp.]|nr:ATP-binding protein [Psychrosphaera sp.]